MKSKKPARRNGVVFIGAYVPADLKAGLRRMATERHATLSKMMVKILKEAVEQQKG